MDQPAKTVHVPVLLDEVLALLEPSPGQHIVDGTLGGGGHTRALLDRVEPDGWVLGLDRDPAALATAERNFVGRSLKLSQANFCELPEVLASAGVAVVDAILLDLGLSSDQLADTTRGFSFQAEGPLDLRFDASRGEPASHLVMRLKEGTLADLLFELGEERYSRKIARAIVARREKEPIRLSSELAAIVRRCYPPAERHGRIDPATRTFQALRIAVNEELKSLEIALRRLPDCLRPGGKLAIISFHSLEDRRVKEAFLADTRLTVVTRRPVTATEEEKERNPRSRSAKLRVAQRR